MVNMSGWDLVLVTVAVYVAVTTLIHMMARRRDTYVKQFREQIERELKRKKRAEQQQQRARRKGAA